MSETSAGWYPDPLGRHHHRYWDGEQWTAHAATAGREVHDPLDRPPPPGAGAARTNGKAVAALVCGIGQIALPVLGAIAAIVLGVMARAEIRESGGTQEGQGLATAGIVLGVLGLVLVALFVILVLAVVPWSQVEVSTLAPQVVG